MTTWYFPAWNGDVRIETHPDDDQKTLITIIEPTIDELRVLSSCAKLFSEEKWLGRRKTIWNPKGNRDRQETVIEAPLVKVGLTLMANLKPGITTLTAVKMTDGSVSAMGSLERGFLAWLNRLFDSKDKPIASTTQLAELLEAAASLDPDRNKAWATSLHDAAQSARQKDAKDKQDKELQEKQAREDKEKAELEASKKREEQEKKEPPPHRQESKEEKKPKPEKAASVKRPTACCPQCHPGAVPAANEVLQAFLTPEQHALWAKERAIIVVGHLSGHRYLVSHRRGRHAARAGKICFDLDDCAVLHFHDNSVPPEEEVLATKLILEHREPWLRHEATCLGGPFDWVFKNPFGDGLDGVRDSNLTGDLGGALAQLVGLPPVPACNPGYSIPIG